MLLVLLLAGQFVIAGGSARLASASGAWSYNWEESPATPQPWVPNPVNDWDLISNNDGPTNMNGTMQAQDGPDCSPPPATHQIQSLSDSAFICRNQMNTAIYGGGNAYATYGAVYFTPPAMVDFSQGAASIKWQVSTHRSSTRDWWDVWIAPFNENLVVPLSANLPAYNGPPKDAVHIKMDAGICQRGQPNTLGTVNGSPIGSIFTGEVFSNFTSRDISQPSGCVEDATAASATTRSPFELDISSSHVRFLMPGTTNDWVDAGVTLPFDRGVVTFGHHSYNPDKACDFDGSCGPNTYHWSNFAISSAQPFTMLRGDARTVTAGTTQTVHLPQSAPAGSFLRFAALGDISVSFDGGHTFQAAREQLQAGQGGQMHPEAFSSYWTSVPAGTTSIVFNGRSSPATNQPFWVEDVAVWSQGSQTGVTPPATPDPAPTPTGTPAPQPTATLGASIQFRSSSTSIDGGGTVARPAGVTKGALLLAQLEVDADPASVAAPSGWNLSKDTVVAAGTAMAFHQYVYFHVAGALEPSSYAFRTPTGAWTDAQVVDYSGVSTSGPIDAIASRDAGSTSTPRSPSVTSTAPGGRLVVFLTNWTFSSFSPAAGMTKRTDFDANSAMDQPITSAGPTGTRTVRVTASGPIGVTALVLRSS
jgi:hypothetical protein